MHAIYKLHMLKIYVSTRKYFYSFINCPIIVQNSIKHIIVFCVYGEISFSL